MVSSLPFSASRAFFESWLIRFIAFSKRPVLASTSSICVRKCGLASYESLGLICAMAIVRIGATGRAPPACPLPPGAVAVAVVPAAVPAPPAPAEDVAAVAGPPAPATVAAAIAAAAALAWTTVSSLGVPDALSGLVANRLACRLNTGLLLADRLPPPPAAAFCTAKRAVGGGADAANGTSLTLLECRCPLIKQKQAAGS